MAKTMTLQIGGDLPPIRIRRNSRARRLSLRVSQADGAVTLTTPPWIGEGEMRRFLEKHADWLRDARPDPAAGRDWLTRRALPFRGVTLPIVADGRPGRTAQARGGQILVPGPTDALVPRVAAFLKAQARGDLAFAADHYAEKLGCNYKRLSLRDTRSRWGSCSSDGNLMFSWRLIMAPPEVLHYVAAHEVAHLAHMDHSPLFWDTVERLMPDYRAHRDWLRKEGSALQRIRFD